MWIALSGLYNMTALPYSTFRVWDASDFWPFLINIFALLFDTYRISVSPSLLSHLKSFSWLNFQSFSKIFWHHYFVLSPLHSTWPYVFKHFKLCYWRFSGVLGWIRQYPFVQPIMFNWESIKIQMRWFIFYFYFSFIFFNQLGKQTLIFNWCSLLSYVECQLNLSHQKK